MSEFVCFGEVLWDVFPTYKKIGGAPLNVALRLQSFQNEVALISCLGNDPYGNELKSRLQELGVKMDHIQLSKKLETSEVEVVLDEMGAASYTIHDPCAWDDIQLNKGLISLVKNTKVFIFGSLIARGENSRNTLIKLLSVSEFSVFDVNLRPPHYNFRTLEILMRAADFIKFNDEELVEIVEKFDAKHLSFEQSIKFIASKTNTSHVCVTRGSKGAILFYENSFCYNKGYQVKVADTVGSGDSFLATLIDALLKKLNPQKAIDMACAVGAIVAQNQGANPTISSQEIETFLQQN